MFKYLWMVTQDLFLTVALTTLMHVFLCQLTGRKGRLIHGIALGAGVLASIALAAVKFNTKLIISSHWNHYIYAVILALTFLILVLTVLFGRKETAGFNAGSVVLCAAGSLLSAALIFYSLPGVLLYPFSFNTMGQGYLSSYYLVRMAGWLGALVLLLVFSRLLSRCALYIKPYGLIPAALNAGLLSFAVYCFGRFFVPWVNRAKWLKWPVKYTDAAYGWIGEWMMFTANHAMLFTWITAGISALLAVFLFHRGTAIKEPYDNPAQLRKLKARNRHWRRVAAGVMICVILCAVIMTAVKASDTKQVELSAPEAYTVDQEAGVVLVPMENVSDGHLHRFEYKTEKNISVRWIVVKKPNSAAFGVGLDACEVCGNAGYFERNGQIICKRCDVVMNINTIGFKGGCNPIPMPYEVKDGNLVFRLSDIIAGEKEFR
ncbi:MAG: DUF2318 domain-containing protein [Clostridiales bacterium]|nr:DUF2318 domain-containing protein [Clostridiales bacterium]